MKEPGSPAPASGAVSPPCCTCSSLAMAQMEAGDKQEQSGLSGLWELPASQQCGCVPCPASQSLESAGEATGFLGKLGWTGRRDKSTDSPLKKFSGAPKGQLRLSLLVFLPLFLSVKFLLSFAATDPEHHLFPARSLLQWQTGKLC